MKLKNVVFLLSLVLISFQACIPSLHPLYTKDKLVMKKELPGSWINSEEEKNISFSKENNSGNLQIPKEHPTIWNFKANKDQSYSLVYFDENNKPAAFDAHLIKLGGHYFLNFYPRDPSEEEKKKYTSLTDHDFNNFESLHYHAVNTFAKVTFEKDQMTIAPFDGEYIEELLDQNRIRIKHEKVNDKFILTAKPAELQKFILKYADDENAFPEPTILRRQ